MELTLLLLIGLVGFIAGLGSGLFGIGGGSIRIPLLNLIGFTLISAYGMNLIALPISSLIGAISQKQNVDLCLGKYMILGGSIGTVLGTLIAFNLATSSIALAIVFLLVSLLSVIGLNLHSISPAVSEGLKPSPVLLSSGTFFFNTLTGMRGGSEGSLFVPLLKSLNVDMHKAIATALFAAIFTSLVGVFLYWSQEHLLLLTGLVVMIGSGIGSGLGSKISVKTKPKWLQESLTIVIIVLAVLTVLKAVLV